MKNLRRSIRRPVFASTAAMLVLLGATACDGSKDKPTNTASTGENVVLPADESREQHHAQGVAAEMHNKMSAEQGNQKGAGQGGMADDQMGSGGMMDDQMPMGKAPTGGPKAGMADKPGNSMAKPMEDDM